MSYKNSSPNFDITAEINASSSVYLARNIFAYSCKRGLAPLKSVDDV